MWIVSIAAPGSCRERMRFIISSGKRPLLQDHIGEKGNTIFLAIVKDASPFRGTMQQTEMVLHRRDFCRKNLIYPLYLGEIMVGNANLLNLAALSKVD